MTAVAAVGVMTMDHHTAQASLTGTLTLIVFGAAVVAALALGLRRRWWGWMLGAAVAGGVFQLGHFAEHLAQAGYWTAHRGQAPWMTPWASALADSFGGLAPGTPSFGIEALHLAGNVIFLAGAVAILAVVVRYGPAASHRPARAGVVVQTVHVVEHVALTVTVVAGGRAGGLSTLFGLLDPGPGLWTYRVWWHLTINAIGTAFIAVAITSWRRHAVGTAPQHPAFAG